MGLLDDYLESWHILKTAVKKSKNIDKTLKDKIDSRLVGKMAILNWLMLSFVIALVLLNLLLPLENLVTQFIGIDFLYYVSFFIFIFIFSQERIKGFISAKIEASRPEIQLFFYFFFNLYLFFILFILTFGLGTFFFQRIELEKLSGLEPFFFYLGYVAINMLIFVIIVKFVFLIVDDILKKIIEKETLVLRRERENLSEKISKIAESSSDEINSERIQLDYWKKSICESRLKVIQDEIERVRWKYRQEPPILAIIAASFVLISPFAKLVIDILELLL